jgi:type II secretory pathway pseudopilin PulG
MAVGLVAILSTVAIPVFTNFVKDAQRQVTRERMDAIRKAIVGDGKLIGHGQLMQPGYEAQVGALPGTLNDLVTICGTCSAYNAYTKNGWRGPYLSNITGWNQDAWGQTITYSTGARTLTSQGPDRTASTSDDIVISF